jgi:hypothetical protein
MAMAEILGVAAVAAYMVSRMTEQLLWNGSHVVTRVCAFITIVLVVLALAVSIRSYNVLPIIRGWAGSIGG